MYFGCILGLRGALYSVVGAGDCKPIVKFQSHSSTPILRPLKSLRRTQIIV